jgi:hypothetical protein
MAGSNDGNIFGLGALSRIIGDSLWLDQNVETLTGNKILVATDKSIQKLDPGGASRDVLFPAEASSTDLVFWLHNAADGSGENLVPKNDGGVAIGTALGPGMSGMYSCDGTAWKCLYDTGVYYDAVSGDRGIGTASPGAKLM